jgi:dihydrofolate reductase
LFVLTHEPPADSPEGGVYTFVTGAIEDALEQAKTAAGDKDVTVMGGADTGRQYLAAGLVDGSPYTWSRCCSAAAPGRSRR